MRLVRLQAHAKVNLYLRVGSVRPDGYHDIESVTQSLELHDQLELISDERLVVECDDPTISPQDNLAFRAADTLRRAFRVREGARLHLKKSIPVAAGLGGGSADAAAALVGLDRLWGLGLSMERLEALGAEVGADVPACIRGGTNLVTGFGEKVTPLDDLGPGDDWILVLVTSERKVRAGDAYRLLDHKGAREGSLGSASITKAIKDRGLEGAVDGLSNDLEAAVVELAPEVVSVKAALLSAGARGALVSGSGPTVFGLFDRLVPDTERISGLPPGCNVIKTGFHKRGVELESLVRAG